MKFVSHTKQLGKPRDKFKLDQEIDVLARNYLICRAWPSDIPAMREMQQRSMLTLGAGYYSPGELAAFLREIGTMDDAVVSEGHFFVAIDINGAVLGSGGWSRLVPRYAKAHNRSRDVSGPPIVRSVFVEPSAARRGIASAIMHRIEMDARDHGVETLQLMSTLSGVQFYEALGYEPGKRREVPLGGGIRFGGLDMMKPLIVAAQAA